MWRYIEALERKYQIAYYHLNELRTLMPDAGPDEDGLPPIALQAHFEACGRAIVAMPDQLASGVASVAPEMPDVRKATLRRVVCALEDSKDPAAETLRAVLADLDRDGRLNDVRDVRNRSTHRFDEKAYHHGEGWFVDPPTYVRDGVKPYEGPRRLTDYLEVMLGFGEELLVKVPDVEHLASRIAESAQQ